MIVSLRRAVPAVAAALSAAALVSALGLALAQSPEPPATPPEPPEAEPGKAPEGEPGEAPAEPGEPAPAPGSPMALFKDAVARHDTDAALAAARAAADAIRKDKQLNAEDRAHGLTDLAIRIVREVGSGPEAAAAAEALFQEATDIRRVRFGDESPEVADSLDTLSTFHFMLGRYDTAEDEQRRALSLRETQLPAGDPAIAAARYGLGTILFQQGRYSEVEPLLLDALQTFKTAASPDAESISDTLNTLAEVARVRGDVTLARERLNEGLSYVETIPRFQPLLLNNLAGLAKDQGRYDEAEELLKRSLNLRETVTVSHLAREATALLNLAELARLQGKSTEAATLYDRALDEARRGLGPDNPELARFLNQAAVNAQDEGRWDDAFRLNGEGLDLLRRVLGSADPMVAQSLLDRGAMLQARGRGDEALEAIREGLRIRTAASGDKHPEVATARLALARVLEAPAPKDAREAVDRAVTVLDGGDLFPDERAEAHALRARLKRRAGDRTGAIADLETAAGIAEDLRPKSGGGEAARAGRFAPHAVIFDDLALTLFETGRTADGFEAAERGRSRAFLDQLETARVDLRDTLPEEDRRGLKTREQTALARLTEARDQIAFTRTRTDLDPAERDRRIGPLEVEAREAAASVAEVREEARSRSPVWRRSGHAVPPGLTTVQARLVPRRSFLLLYVLGPDRAGLLLIPPAPQPAVYSPLNADTKIAAALGIAEGGVGSEALARAIGPLASALARPPAGGAGWDEGAGAAPGERAPLPARLNALWRLLVPAEVWTRLQVADEVIVLPDGALGALPFEALAVKPAKRLEESTFWLDDGPPIRYAPSAAILRALADLPAGGEGLLSVADPAYTTLPRLPATEEESRQIVQASRRKSLGASPAVVLTGTAATEAQVRSALPGKRFLHLAVHGKVEPRLGDLFAALSLAPPAAPATSAGSDGIATKPAGGASDDGSLMLFEIYDLDLQAELAVLSACVTSRGRAIEGEGSFALSRGFLAAGARRVVASLWSVDDASTAALMGNFFRKMDPDRPYAAALRDARRSVRANSKWKAPFYWAPFLLTGAP
ncbi:MAG TPA: CHAT domain-containing tetratricopeptide repeat protein [Verrucomicrobiae bacterium]|nr:CHAT domain-containing tetratricopeptide repeat protein [Verrucomicrobiae bacterium]